MNVQPKLLTVIISGDDLARTYTTIHSIQHSRYRNHEIVCVIPHEYRSIREHVGRDFPWLPIVTAPFASLASLLALVQQRALVSHVQYLLLIQGGVTLDPNTIHALIDQTKILPGYDLYLPAIVRADGSGVVYGALTQGRWPHQLSSLTVLPESGVMADTHFAGGACLVTQSASARYRLSESSDQLALLLWMEYLHQNAIRSISVSSVSAVFDGSLFCDFDDMMVVPNGWYGDARRYVQKYGTWYDKLVFWLRFSWRRSSSPLARLIDGLWQHRTVSSRAQI